MTFAEYKQRKDKLTIAIVNWMIRTQPNSDKLSRVMARAESTMSIWWNQIENDPHVKIANKLLSKKGA